MFRRIAFALPHYNFRKISNCKIVNRINQLNEDDYVEARAKNLKQLSSLMPKLALVIDKNDSAINNILCMNAIYYDKCLDPVSRIHLRKRVMRFITEHDLSGDAVDDLVKFLSSGGAF